MSENDVVSCKTDNTICRITLNRPDALNAINRDVLERLSLMLDDIKSDSAIQAVIITGAGEKSFSAGADIVFLHQASPLEVREFAREAVAVYHKIETLGKVTVAAINGYALGGGLELAEACTLRYAAHHALLGHPEVRIGALAGWGGTTRLPRLVGRGRATEILLTGRMVNAEEALQIGLVNRIVESKELSAETEKTVREILSHAPFSVKFTLEAISRGLNLALEESTGLGADYFGLIASTDDFREGTRAFLHKSKPEYKGR